MGKYLDIFRKDYLNANTWVQRKEGVPLDLLDKLTEEELKTAEAELIHALSTCDTWIIIGLAHIKSQRSLATLYQLLLESTGALKVTLAYAIFLICADPGMIDITLEETPKVSGDYELIDLFLLLPRFNDPRVKQLLNTYRDDKNYLVAYNATYALGLPTDKVIERFRNPGTG